MTAPNEAAQVEDEFDINFDHTKLAGDIIDDPWDDKTQTDWADSDPIVDADEDDVQEEAS